MPFCRFCGANKNLQRTDLIAFRELKANQTCSANYKGSAPNLEVTRANIKFSWSLDNRKLRYDEMYSEEDRKTYTAIKEKL